jgi:hypothetical protein
VQTHFKTSNQSNFFSDFPIALEGNIMAEPIWDNDDVQATMDSSHQGWRKADLTTTLILALFFFVMYPLH